MCPVWGPLPVNSQRRRHDEPLLAMESVSAWLFPGPAGGAGKFGARLGDRGRIVTRCQSVKTERLVPRHFAADRGLFTATLSLSLKSRKIALIGARMTGGKSATGPPCHRTGSWLRSPMKARRGSGAAAQSAEQLRTRIAVTSRSPLWRAIVVSSCRQLLPWPLAGRGAFSRWQARRALHRHARRRFVRQGCLADRRQRGPVHLGGLSGATAGLMRLPRPAAKAQARRAAQ